MAQTLKRRGLRSWLSLVITGALAASLLIVVPASPAYPATTLTIMEIQGTGQFSPFVGTVAVPCSLVSGVRI